MADRLHCIDRRIKMKSETIADHTFQEGIFDEKKDAKILNFTVGFYNIHYRMHIFSFKL